MTNSLNELMERYDLELDKVVEQIKEENAKIVLLQFPDGLKFHATAIVDYLKSKTLEVEFLIWFGPCWGACDTPVGFDYLKEKIDLMIQFGHNALMPSY